MAEKLCELRKKGGGGEKYTETVLWTNPSPTASSFANQDVTLSDSLANYEYVKIVYGYVPTDLGSFSTIYKVSEFVNTVAPATYGFSGVLNVTHKSNGLFYDRRVLYKDTNTITFGSAFGYKNNGTASISNAAAIPLEILGLNELDHGGMIVDALWTNPNPTSAFAAQTISLDLSNYDAVLIDGVYSSNYAPHSGQTRVNTFYIEKGQSYDACYGWVISGSLWVTYRNTTVNANGVVFGGGYYYNNASRTAQDTIAVPMAIYGVKNRLA